MLFCWYLLHQHVSSFTVGNVIYCLSRAISNYLSTFWRKGKERERDVGGGWDLEPIVNKHFDRISAAQWNLLAAGICDSGVATTQTEILHEIIQTLSTSTISIVLPMFLEHLLRNDSPDDISADLENLNTQLGDSLVLLLKFFTSHRTNVTVQKSRQNWLTRKFH